MIGNVLRALTGAGQRVPPAIVNETVGWMPAQSTAGVTVTPNGSLASTTVLACVNLIARSLASVPLVLYRRTATGAEPALDHRLYTILHDVANPLQTAMEVRETMLANVLLHGNAYCEIEWGADGYPLALWPLSADRVGLRITPDRKLIYIYYSDQFGQIGLPAWRVHHLRGLATTGLLGISPIRQAAGAVGLALATEQFSSLSFENGAHPSLVLSHPAKLTPEAMKNLRSSFEMQWSGLSNAHRIAVVGEGVKPEPVNVTAAEAQVQETRIFQVAEICRIYNVAPGLVGASETQTYASAEQDMIRFRELTLGPWAEAMEKRIAIDLLTPAERADYYAQHKLAKLQATDLATRYNTYNIAKQAGILTTNEIRQMEDYNPVDGGDELWMPMNMAPASAVAAQADGSQGNSDQNAGDPASRNAPAPAPVLGYHIEQGVVTRNEARASIGLPAIDDSTDAMLRNLRAKLEVMTVATGAGIPPPQAAEMVGLSIQEPDVPHDGSPDVQQPNDPINHPEDQPDDEPNDQPSDGSMARAALDGLIADVERRVRSRVANDVRQAGAKALRNGGRLGLSEWGETQIHGWREAGDEMLQPVAQMAAALGGTDVVDVGGWVTSAYQASVRSLIGGDDAN